MSSVPGRFFFALPDYVTSAHPQRETVTQGAGVPGKLRSALRHAVPPFAHNGPQLQHADDAMKTLTLLTGVLFAISASAHFNARAALVGKHVTTHAGSAILICEYSGERARFEIMSQNGTCAPYINVQ